MPIRKVTFVEDDCTSSRRFELFNASRIFRLLGMDIEFGVVSGTNLPIILKGPYEVPESGPFSCFYGAPWKKDVSKSLTFCSTIEDRVFSLMDAPARPDEFDPSHILAMETAGHCVRCLAMFEENVDERFVLFSKAYKIYEGVLLSLCSSTLRSIVETLRADLTKINLFQPVSDMPQMSSTGRRVVSHTFAGMALCMLMGQWSAIKFASLVSAAVIWEERFPVQLAASLRILPLFMGLEDVQVPGAGLLDKETYISRMLSSSLIFGIHTSITEKILLPALLLTYRMDLFRMELGLVDDTRRDKCEQFARAIHARGVERLSSPCALASVFTHVIDGKIIERTCPSCGVWDRTGKSHLRCSRCMLVYYCNKECQLAHWAEHKKICKKKK
jgi:hypothetical protein